MKIVSSDQMRAIEGRSGKAGVSTATLMENAGLAFADRVRHHLDPLDDRSVVVLVGPGHNGGDGLVAGRHLSEWGADVTVVLCRTRPDDDPHLAAVVERGMPVVRAWENGSMELLQAAFQSADSIVDAVLGTGRARPIEGILKEVLACLIEAQASRPEMVVIALDLPTGLDADTGQVDPVCPVADVTVTLGYPKLGEFIFPGADHTGALEITAIGLPDGVDDDVDLELMTDDWAVRALPERPSSAHKGTFGRALIVAGSKNYIGAAYLASSAAGRVGSGLVTLAIPESLQMAVAAQAPEPTYLPLPETERGVPLAEAAKSVLQAASGYKALLVGCGMGQAAATQELLSRLLLSDVELPPTVIDADGLNFLAHSGQEWWDKLPLDVILTPHPGEMARLTGATIADVNADRIGVAQRYSSQWKKTVVLKGAHTIVAYADGRAMVSPFANPGLASAGTGDVLAGAIVGLLSQGVVPEDAAALGVYLHGLAGEALRQEIGETGILASDLLPRLPVVVRDLVYGAP